MKKNLPTMLFAAATAVLLTFSTAFSNTANATSAQDSWWIPSESGWGLNVLQEGGTLGLAMYVYDNNSLPVWYLGSGTGNLTAGFSGQMYTYRGPYFGGFFNPNTVTATPVGSFTFRITSVNSAEFQYTINGITVTKSSLQRLGVGTANLTGPYTGAMVYRIFSCNSGNPQNFVDNANFTIAQNGSSITISSVFPSGSSCSHTGTYAQDGRYGRISGNYTCSAGATGTFEMFEIETGSQSFSGRYTATLASGALRCNQEGRMGGVNTTPTNY